jgi:hypothetical protein
LRAAFVNRAATIVLIEKHAHRFVDMVLAVAEHADLLTFMLYGLRELLPRDVDGDAMMFCQTNNVARFGLDVIVTTAIAGTLGTVVANFFTHGSRISGFA